MCWCLVESEVPFTIIAKTVHRARISVHDWKNYKLFDLQLPSVSICIVAALCYLIRSLSCNAYILLFYWQLPLFQFFPSVLVYRCRRPTKVNLKRLHGEFTVQDRNAYNSSSKGIGFSGKNCRSVYIFQRVQLTMSSASVTHMCVLVF